MPNDERAARKPLLFVRGVPTEAYNAIGIHTTRRVIERYYENRKFYGGIWRKAFGPEVENWYKERIARIERCVD